MSEAFTPIEYAVLMHLKAEGRGTVPAIAADLLLRPSEVETTVSGLVSRSILKKEGDFYLPGEVNVETPNPHAKKGGTRKLGTEKFPMPTSAPACPAPSEVANVFQQARDRAKRERTAGI